VSEQLAQHLIPIDEFQEPIEFAKTQLKIMWFPDEIKVEKDIQDVLVNFSEAEKEAVITTLKLFSLYETHAGDEYWGGRFKKMFTGAEFHRMASVFSMVELAVHAPFYKKINELLHIDNPEFYLSYMNDSVLNERIKHIGEIINHPNDLVSLGAFSMVEGAILYSNFAFLKHFQSEGKNKLMSTVRGINFSVRDENLHSMAGAWCFRHKVQQDKVSAEDLKEIEVLLRQTANILLEHEKQIIALTFAKGKIEGTTAHQLENFTMSRLNECLKELGFAKEFDVKYDPISSWFYRGINSYQMNDFFSGQGREYSREWDEHGFVWDTNKEKE
jgi:ribonucleotide reductase beta subunit family protein with ferritin-like domain